MQISSAVDTLHCLIIVSILMCINFCSSIWGFVHHSVQVCTKSDRIKCYRIKKYTCVLSNRMRQVIESPLPLSIITMNLIPLSLYSNWIQSIGQIFPHLNWLYAKNAWLSGVYRQFFIDISSRTWKCVIGSCRWCILIHFEMHLNHELNDSRYSNKE